MKSQYFPLIIVLTLSGTNYIHRWAKNRGHYIPGPLFLALTVIVIQRRINPSYYHRFDSLLRYFTRFSDQFVFIDLSKTENRAYNAK